ncbi:glycoside hydrolase family 3 protein [Microbacterium lacus]|uniref:glycoside hydrolase family 3 N-terminal domain-containing protein n=1 Tax=Microbacterium lacus TaxID=415217 RepID=UPI00384B93ED
MTRRRGLVTAAVGCGAILLTTGMAWHPASGATSESEVSDALAVEAATPDLLRTEAEARVAAMSTREKAASLVMGHLPTTDPAALRAYMESSGIGGFILMGANIPATEGELRGITDALTVDSVFPPLLAIDQEGGDVSRIPWDDFPSALALKDLPAAESELAFAGRAALIQRAGIGVNFGIVADVTADSGMFIYRRALGTSPPASAERVSAAVLGEGDSAASTLKHFPGHGAAPGDSHSTIPSTPMSKEQWMSADAVPFTAGIEAGAPLLMYGHLDYPAIDAAPASMSAEWHRIAREELGFEGISITDDLGMLQASGLPEYQDPVATAVAAIAAGNDMVLTVVFSNAETAPRTVDGIVAAVVSGALSGTRLDDAAIRITKLRLDLAAAGRGLVPCAECSPAG